MSLKKESASTEWPTADLHTHTQNNENIHRNNRPIQNKIPSLHLKLVNTIAIVNKLKGSAVHIHQLVVCVDLCARVFW